MTYPTRTYRLADTAALLSVLAARPFLLDELVDAGALTVEIEHLEPVELELTRTVSP